MYMCALPLDKEAQLGSRQTPRAREPVLSGWVAAGENLRALLQTEILMWPFQ